MIREMKDIEVSEVIAAIEHTMVPIWNNLNIRYNLSYLEEVIKNCLKRGHRIYLYEEDGAIKGFVWSGMGKQGTSGEDVGIIYGIAVKTEYQKKGIGRKLIEHEIQYFESNGVKRIQLTVESGNQNALGFYEHVDFREKYKIVEFNLQDSKCARVRELSRPAIIADYDPQRVTLYEEEERRILEVIGHIIVEIEHIGSTAVRDLGAKPVIDIMVAVDSLSDVKKCIEPLQRIGYEYRPQHEASFPERRFFRKGHPPKEQHYHLHMVELTRDCWKKELLFRDYLRTHPKVAHEYYELKKRLAKYGSEGYNTAKTPFIESVVARAKAEKEKQID